MLSTFLLAAALFNPAAANETGRLYLSGRGADDAVPWAFRLSEGRGSEKGWTQIAVPGCWEALGFGTPQYGNPLRDGRQKVTAEVGTYRKDFSVPSDWRGRAVDLVFEGVMTDTRVKVNGKSAGALHQGGFFRFRYDISELLDYDGVNQLEVEVAKESADASVNRAERRGDYWTFGGIFRPVFLESHPRLHITDVLVDARADGTLTAKLLVSDGSTRLVTRKRENPRLWTAETPNLYDEAFELVDEAGRVLHRVVKRIGYRTIEARPGEGLFINGTRVDVRGVCRHAFRPATGRTLSPRLCREDVALIKSLNMNAVRLSHYPTDPDFLDLCDELGLYVECEFPGWQAKYDTGVGEGLVKSFVLRDQFHPSVIWWSNGNEGGFNFELDHLYGELDLQRRPLLHPWSDFGGFDTKHYPDYAEVARRLAKGKSLFMPTEIQHGLWDGGHAAGLRPIWDLIRTSPNGVGCFLWSLADEGLLVDGHPDCQGRDAPDGIVGPNHEREGSYDAIREIWSPVQVAFTGSELVVSNRYAFTDLSACALDIQPTPGTLRRLQPALAPGQVLRLSVAEQLTAATEALAVTARDPSGRELFTWRWPLKKGAGFVHGPAKAPPAVPVPQAIAWQVTAKRNSWGGEAHWGVRPVDVDLSYWFVTNADQSVTVRWQLATTNAVEALGVDFPLASKGIAHKRFRGKGPYRVWRNRLDGPQWGVWDVDWNMAQPNVRWTFPEFQGWFADVDQAVLTGEDGRTVQFATEAPYTGFLTPQDGPGGYLFTYPKLGLTFMSVIPAVPCKFFNAARTCPAGRPVRVPGPVTGQATFYAWEL